jgi:hypothetical protein
MTSRFLTLMTGRNLLKIRQPREPQALLRCRSILNSIGMTT